MKITNFKINATADDGTIVTFDSTTNELVIAYPVPAPIKKKWVVLNVINWGTLKITAAADEYTYFVLPVLANGTLTGTSDAAEKKFVADVHALGKIACFSIAGGSNNVANITSAVMNNRAAFINNIYNHLVQYGFDGVTVDIENTSIDPDVMVTFFKELRAKLGLKRKIGVYTQPYQLNFDPTVIDPYKMVWNKFEQAAQYIDWLAPMCYDFANTVAEAEAETLRWLPKVGGDKSKLLFGAAVNYNATGLDITEFPQILDWVNAQGLGGVGIWQDQIYTQPYQDILKAKFK